MAGRKLWLAGVLVSAAALAWLQFVTGADVQQQIVQEEGWFPVSKTALSDPADVAALPVLTTYQESTQYVTKRWGVPWSSELDQLMSVSIIDAMNQKNTPREALDTLATKTQALVDKYLKK